jgi:hypothetical protein
MWIWDPNFPPKLGGVPSAARRGGSLAELLQHAALEPPLLLARLAGTPPNLGGEFGAITTFVYKSTRGTS